MSIRNIVYAFNSGELSPFLDGRIDISKYLSGCRELLNFIVTPYGSAVRRPGTEFMSEVKDSNDQVWLSPFRHSVDQAYILEFGDKYIRFFRDGGQVLDGGAAYEIATPFLKSELSELQFVQSVDVMFLTHSNHFPQRLSRLEDNNWVLEAVPFKVPPFQDDNITDTTITPSGVSGSGITLTASESLFEAGHVGSYWEIVHVRDDNEISGSFVANGNSDTIRVDHCGWQLITHEVWNGTIKIERSFDDGATWGQYRSYSSNNDWNGDITGKEELDDVLYRITMTDYTSGTCDYEFNVQDYFTNGIVKITAFTSDTSVTADVFKLLGKTDATKEWSEGAFSDVAGYPACLVIHEERLCLAATRKEPQRIWCSRSNSWLSFERGSYDDHTIVRDISSDAANDIRWLVSRNSLIIGTAGGEFTMSAPSSDQALTPANATITPQSNYGSMPLSAELVNEAVLFIQRQGRKVREFVFSFERNGYVCPDMTILAEHITIGNIIQTAFQQQPDGILWAVTGDGKLIGMTYEREQKVIGWHRHDTDGLFESVAVIPGSGEDEIWVSVKREINGVTKRFIERFRPRSFADQEDCFYVDCGLAYDDVETQEISGLDHLEGESVAVFADGAVRSSKDVDSGEIQLQYAASKLCAGLPYTSRLRPMKPEFSDGVNSTMGLKRNIRNVIVRFFNTLGGKVGTPKKLYPVNTRTFDTPLDTAPELFTGDYDMGTSGSFDRDGDIIIEQSAPAPMTILNIMAEIEV